MSEDISRLLRDLAQDAPEGAEELARDAWATAARLRRRRNRVRIAMAAAGTVAVCGAMIVVVSAGPEPAVLPVAPPSDIAAPRGIEVSHLLPAKGAESALPLLPTELPPEVYPDAAKAVPLASDPVRRAVALFQTDSLAPVQVLGDDGRMRKFDVGPITNERFAALRESSLSPDGRTAVIPQTDGLLVVDLTTGGTRLIGLPGTFPSVSWHPVKPLVMVEDEEHGYLVDLAAGTYSQLARGSLFFGEHDIAPLMHHGKIADWWGVAATRGTLFASAAFDRQGNGVVVLCERSGVIRTALGSSAGDGRWKGGTRVLRWQDDATVLLVSDGERPMVLAWRVDTGEVLRVMQVQRRAVISV